MSGTSPSAAAAASAGQAGDDDAEQGDDGVDDGLQSGGNGVNDGHDAVADRAEDGLDLRTVSQCTGVTVYGVNVRRKLRHPCLRLCDVCAVSVNRSSEEVGVRAWCCCSGLIVRWNVDQNKCDSLTYNKPNRSCAIHVDVTPLLHCTVRANFPQSGACSVIANSTTPCFKETCCSN